MRLLPYHTIEPDTSPSTSVLSRRGSKDLEIPLGRTAQAIRQRLNLIDHEYTGNVFSLYSSTPTTKKIRQDVAGGKFFILSSWAETGFGFEDWGNRLGKPDRVRIPDMPGDGMAAVLPKIGEDGGLDVVMLWMKLSWDV